MRQNLTNEMLKVVLRFTFTVQLLSSKLSFRQVVEYLLYLKRLRMGTITIKANISLAHYSVPTLSNVHTYIIYNHTKIMQQ